MYRLLFIVLIAFCVGCSKSESADDGSKDMRDDAPISDTGRTDASQSDAASCIPLFGSPGPQTGLGSELCSSSCGCDLLTVTPTTEDDVSSWSDWTLDPPLELLDGNPYGNITLVPADGVCVAVFDSENGTYSLETRDEPGDGIVTHTGPCGLCSTLQDLATYINIPDLTEPVRECGLQGINGGAEGNRECLEQLGFTEACAQIWYYNTLHTREKCIQTCFELLDDPYHEPDGSLNDCLACDEENSGPVFKQVAGRTRRNSGLASAICRPCETVSSVEHTYPSR